jgi:hypothetical protein
MPWRRGWYESAHIAFPPRATAVSHVALHLVRVLGRRGVRTVREAVAREVRLEARHRRERERVDMRTG